MAYLFQIVRAFHVAVVQKDQKVLKVLSKMYEVVECGVKYDHSYRIFLSK